MSLLTGLRKLIQQQGCDKTYWIAYSGGVDSRVLLALCHHLQVEQSLLFRVIHINHGLSPNASVWAQHCADVCAQYHLPFEQVSIALCPDVGISLEALAREKRYEIFAQRMQAGDVLLTAHHQDDQAETFLLQLIRGSGVKGLSAMPVVKSFANGIHARPLLDCTRDTLLQYAREQQFDWVEDESNNNSDFSRNYLRHHVMPTLQQRWPSISSAISRSARHCAEAQQLLAEYGSQLIEKCDGSVMDTLSVSALQQLSSQQQKLVLRTWITSANFSLPDINKMESILQDVLTADWDRFPCVSWGEVELRRHRDDLYIMQKLSEHDVTQRVEWQVDQLFTLPGIGVFSMAHFMGQNLPANIKVVEVRFRQGGEMLELPGRCRQSLKNLFQEWNIAPWLRDRLPLIYLNEKLVGLIFSRP